MAVSITKRQTKGKVTRYRAQVRVSGHAHVSRTFSRKKAAQDWGRTEEDRLRSLAPGSPVNKTVSEVIEQYKKKRLKSLKSARTRETHLDWWDDRIGTMKLFEVLPAHISDCLRALEEPDADDNIRSAGTINRYHSSIGAVLKYAHKTLHWMPSNPSRDVQRGEESRGRVRWLDDEERAALLQSCKESGWNGLYPLVLLALATGARQGELLTLTWDRVDLKEGTAYLDTTKSGERRTLPVRGPALTVDRRARMTHLWG